MSDELENVYNSDVEGNEHSKFSVEDEENIYKENDGKKESLEYEEILKQDALKLNEISKESAEKISNNDSDERSVHVGNVHFAVKVEELRNYFEGCGGIKRVTILTDKATMKPKGFAYVEFEDADSVQRALELNDTQLHGRVIKVQIKRTNIPGLSRPSRGGYFGPQFGGYPRGFVYFPPTAFRGGRGGAYRGRGRGHNFGAPY